MDALEEVEQIENRANCKRVLESVIEGEPECVVVFFMKEGEIPGFIYCASNSVAVTMVELGKAQMVFDMLGGGCDCEEGE